MRSWIHRLLAVAALCGAAALHFAARGAPAHASIWLPALRGDGIASVSGVAAIAVVSVATLVALSPAGRARG
jgi:hypothetical protein